MFGKKRKETPKKTAAAPLKEYSFTQSEHFKGFKKCSLTVYGIAEFLDKVPVTEGKQIKFKEVRSIQGSSWKVYLGSKHIGSLFDSAAQPFNDDKVDAVYLKYDNEIVNGEERIRPHLFIHFKV
jgi:hypothetical protein